jgi:glycosyltransferase involved in cell wall biosynthesis
MSLPTVSVVMPTYRRRDRFADAVNAIAADPHAMEIILVVDGYDDGTLEAAQEMARTEPRLRPVWQANRGLEGARQAGLELASGDVVLFLDDDVIADPGLARGHAQVHARVPDAVVLGYMPTLQPQRREPGNFSTVLYAVEYERACEAFEDDPSSVITHLWAGNMSLRRSDAQRIGVEGVAQLVRLEDREFGLRCAESGLTGVFDRTLGSVHSHARDLDSFAREALVLGGSRRRLGELYPQYVGAHDPRADLSWPVRAVVTVAAGPVVHRLSRAAFYKGAQVAGRRQAWGLEMACGRLLRQVELVRGYEGRA